MSLAAFYADHLQQRLRQLDTLLTQQGIERLLIYSGVTRYRFRDDQSYPFSLNPYFRRWLPFVDQPGCLIVLGSGLKPRLYYVCPEDIWHLSAPLPGGEWLQRWEVVELSSSAQLKEQLQPTKHWAFIGEDIDLAQELGVERVNPEGLLNGLDWHSAVKTSYEVELIRQASSIALRGHRAAAEVFVQHGSELQIHQAYLQASEQTETELPYPNIVALNRHAAVLHYQRQQRSIPKQQFSLLLDAGAQVSGYSADITRTYAACDGAFAELIGALEQLQQQLCAQVQPGCDFVELNQICHQLLAQLLVEQGLVSGSVESIVAAGITRSFLPHGLGHLLGAQVHDAGGWLCNPQGEVRTAPEQHPFLRLTRKLEAGMVLTIEPGLYFIEPLLARLVEMPAGRQVNWKRIEALRDYGGVRIEDNLWVTPSGADNLTRQAEALMQALP